MRGRWISDDSRYESALHPGPSEPLSISPGQVEARIEGSQTALPFYGSISSFESHGLPSPPLPSLEDPTVALKPLLDRPETSKDSDISLPNCERANCGTELSDSQICSQSTSDSEGRSSDKVRHVSTESSLPQEKAWNQEDNSHLSADHSPDQTSSNSGSENGYDDTSEASVLDCSQRALIARLMDEICSSFFYQISHRARQRGQVGEDSQKFSSSSTDQLTSTNSLIGESLGSRRKRSRKDDEDPEDEDDGKNKRPRNQKPDDGHSTRVRYFACPFHKFDASTYSSGNADPRVGLKYRSCGPPGWPNIGKLK